MNKIFTLLALSMFFVGCNSEVLRLRGISENVTHRKISDTVMDILFYAEQAASRGENYTMKRFMATEPEVKHIVVELKKVDRRFSIETNNQDGHTDLIVRW